MDRPLARFEGMRVLSRSTWGMMSSCFHTEFLPCLVVVEDFRAGVPVEAVVAVQELFRLHGVSGVEVSVQLLW